MARGRNPPSTQVKSFDRGESFFLFSPSGGRKKNTSQKVRTSMSSQRARVAEKNFPRGEKREALSLATRRGKSQVFSPGRGRTTRSEKRREEPVHQHNSPGRGTTKSPGEKVEGGSVLIQKKPRAPGGRGRETTQMRVVMGRGSALGNWGKNPSVGGKRTEMNSSAFLGIRARKLPRKAVGPLHTLPGEGKPRPSRYLEGKEEP